MPSPSGTKNDHITVPQWILGGPGLTIQERGVLAHMIATREHGDGGDIATHLRSPLLAQDDPHNLQTTLDGLVSKGLLNVERNPICDGPVYSLNLPGEAL